MTIQTTSTTLNRAIADSQELLTKYALREELTKDLTITFGAEYDTEAAQDLVEQWQTGDFGSFPEIEILASDTINGPNGAYSVDTNKIYISEEYLLANSNNIQAVSNLVLEEYGHYVDASINSVDAAGDEGAIFSGLVRGESFTDGELQQLQLEDDRATVNIDGEEITIEQATVNGSSFANVLNGTSSSDVFNAYSGNDLLHAYSGDDTLYAGHGNDNLYAGHGNDNLYGGDGNDNLYGGDGNDYFSAGDGNDYFSAGNGNDTLNAGDGDDTLNAGDGDDTLNGGYGDDTLNGGYGDDILAGGTGTNNLSGGEGSDTFVIESSGLQIVEDFERGTDKIDITASGAQQISLDPNGEDTNIIDHNGTTLGTVQGQIISTEDLILSDFEQQSLFPELNVSEQNITELIKAWGDEFAQQQGSSIDGNIDMSRVNFELKDIDFAKSIEIPSVPAKVTSTFANATAGVGSQTIEINNSKTLETTITTENQTSLGTTAGVATNTDISISNTVVGNGSASFFGIGGGIEKSRDFSSVLGISTNLEKTFQEVLTQSESETESQTLNIPISNTIDIEPQSIVYNNIFSLTGTKDVPITMSYSIGGDFEFTLENDESFSVPINAILQHYDLQDGQLDTFQPAVTTSLQKTDFDGNGTSVFYSDTLNFEQVGSLEITSTFYKTSVSSVTDVLLNGGLLNGNSQRNLEIIRDEFGAPQQVRYNAKPESERLWIVQDSLTSNMQADIITGYLENDQIGISHPQITAIDELTIEYTGGNADIHFGEQHLARINGVDPNSLKAKNFIFSTVGTIFDPNTIMGIDNIKINSYDDLDVSYSNGNADIQFEAQSLTVLDGVAPNSLNSSNFVFETEGTVFDTEL